MNFIFKLFFCMWLPVALHAEKPFIPEHFADGQIIEKMILIIDVDGTLQVLNILHDGIGKSFNELRYIPSEDIYGVWNWHSYNDVNRYN